MYCRAIIFVESIGNCESFVSAQTESMSFQEEDRNMQLFVFKHNTCRQIESSATRCLLRRKYLYS
jgi:hypothetical protein